MKGKVKFEKNEEIPQKNAKNFDKFLEKHGKHGVSDKFSVILTFKRSGTKILRQKLCEIKPK